jgi:uncharacterized protein with HEPN domain
VSSEGPAVHFRDILESIANIETFIGDLDFEAYKEDLKTKSAVERQLQIVAEAAYRLGDEAPTLCPEPNWKDLRAMGNILRHAYHRIDDAILWEVVKHDLPSLKDTVTSALTTLG